MVDWDPPREDAGAAHWVHAEAATANIGRHFAFTMAFPLIKLLFPKAPSLGHP